MSDPCADFELALRRAEADLTVAVRFTPAGSSATVRLIDGDLPRVSLSPEVRRELLAAGLDMAQYGRILSAALFADPRLAAALSRAWASAQSSGAGLRLRLDLDEREPDLHDLAWEALAAPAEIGGQPLAMHERLRLSRFLSSADMRPVMVRPRSEVRALIVIAAPDDLDAFNLAPIDCDAELARARTALGAIPATVLARGASEPATLEALVAALRDGPDLVYLACHGSLHRGQPFLWLEDEDGLAKRVNAQVLVDRLQALEHCPLLVALASCESAGGQGMQATLTALGPRLVAAGVPAVLGMQGSIAMTAVATCMPIFFRELLRDGQVDRALAAARASLLASAAWWQPILWMRSSDGSLWDAAAPAVVPEAPREAPTNLPSYPGAILGRAADQEALALLLSDGKTRLVSVLGPGGIGKTRLAVAVGWHLRPAFPDGVFFAALATLREPGLVLPTVAQIVGIRDDGSKPLEDQLADWLRSRSVLLLLDNVEHVIGAAELIGRLVRAAPGLHILATSRAALRVSGEHEYLLGPLALPDMAHIPRWGSERLAALQESPAIGLFIARAAAVRPGFTLDSANAEAIAAICARLDGLPLAIELAAARVKLLAPKALLARLTSRLSLLTGGARDVPSHQQTMRSAIAWSFDLLAAPERELFAALAVFAGGFTLEAAETICAAGNPAINILDGIGSLVDNSLLNQSAAAEEEPRFVMLAIMREFALEQLVSAAAADALRRAHAAYYLDVIREARRQLSGGAREAAMVLFERERANLSAALAYYLGFAQAPAVLEREHAQPDSGSSVGVGRADTAALAELAKMMSQFWYIRGYFSEGRRQLADILVIIDTMADRDQALVFSAAAVLAMGQSDMQQAEALFTRQLTICRALGDEGQLQAVLNNLGIVARRLGDYPKARTYAEEGLALARATANYQRQVELLNNLGTLAAVQGDLPAANYYFSACLDLTAAGGDRHSTAHAMKNLARIRQQSGNIAGAEGLYRQALATFEELGDVDGIMAANLNLAELYVLCSEPEPARQCIARALQVGADTDTKERIAECLEESARIAVLEAQFIVAARWWGAAERLREEIRIPLSPADRQSYEQTRDRVKANVDPEAFVAAWASGRALPIEQAVAEVMNR